MLLLSSLWDSVSQHASIEIHSQYNIILVIICVSLAGSSQCLILPSVSSTTYHNPSAVSTYYALPTNVNKRSSDSTTLGIILAPIVSITVIITITLVVGLVVCAKVRKNGKSEISAVHNVAYGTGLQNTATHAEDTYDYRTMDQKNVHFDTKANESYATNMIESVSNMTCDPSIETGGNEAYATNIETRGNEAYATNIETGENEAYATNIETRGNEAYATNIETGENEAYDTIT